jgi:hypothetical protein
MTYGTSLRALPTVQGRAVLGRYICDGAPLCGPRYPVRSGGFSSWPNSVCVLHPSCLSAYTVHGSDNDVVGFRLIVEQELVEVLSGGLLSAVWAVC